MAAVTETGKTYKITGSNINAYCDYTPPGDLKSQHRGASSNPAFALKAEVDKITIIKLVRRVEKGVPVSNEPKAPEGAAEVAFEVVRASVEGKEGEYFIWVVYNGVVKVAEFVEEKPAPLEKKPTLPEPIENTDPPDPPLPDPNPVVEAPLPDVLPSDPKEEKTIGTEIHVKAGETVVLEVQTDGSHAPNPCDKKVRIKLVDEEGKKVESNCRVHFFDENLKVIKASIQAGEGCIDLEDGSYKAVIDNKLKEFTSFKGKTNNEISIKNLQLIQPGFLYRVKEINGTSTTLYNNTVQYRKNWETGDSDEKPYYQGIYNTTHPDLPVRANKSMELGKLRPGEHIRIDQVLFYANKVTDEGRKLPFMAAKISSKVSQSKERFAWLIYDEGGGNATEKVEVAFTDVTIQGPSIIELQVKHTDILYEKNKGLAVLGSKVEKNTKFNATAEVYNLIWIGNEQSFILFPSTLTPLIMQEGDRSFEIIIAFTGQEELEKEAINNSLRFTKKITTDKRYLNCQVSDEEIICLKEIKEDKNGILKTSRFSGEVSKHLSYSNRSSGEKLYGKLTFYLVTLKSSIFLKKGSEINKPSGEHQDCLIKDFIKEINGDFFKEKKPDEPYPGHPYGYHAIKLDTSKEQGQKQKCNPNGEVDIDSPIASYHPVYFFKKKGDLKAGFISDLHLNFRQHLLSSGTVKILEGVSDDISPQLGSLVNVYLDNFRELLEEMYDKVDFIMIGGDIVDYIKNLGKNPTDPSPTEIWELADPDDYNADYIDYIVFYSVIIDFLTSKNKPVFVLSGNHDAFDKGYGISAKLGKLLDAGMPKDHNLTIFEASLLFGEDEDDTLGFSFESDKFGWFYSVLTPFENYKLDIGRYSIIALGWGDKENMVDVNLLINMDIYPLPLAESSLTESQLSLLEKGSNKSQKQILFTHFTVASFDKTITSTSGAKGDISPDPDEDFARYAIGSFEQKRGEFFDKLDNLSMVISGHTHRRAIYSPSKENEQLKATIHDLDEEYEVPKEQNCTLFVVSDSCGPLPVRNKQNEFLEWGFDRGSGLVVSIDENHKRKIEKISVGPKPRACVALNYLENYYKEDDFKVFEELRFVQSENNNQEYKLSCKLNKKVSHIKMTDFKFYFYEFENERILKPACFFKGKPNDSTSTVCISCLKKLEDPKDDDHLYVSIELSLEETKIEGLCEEGGDFGFIKDQYNFTDRWNFSIKLEEATDDDKTFYKIERINKFHANKDGKDEFEWRKKYFSKKYCPKKCCPKKCPTID